MLQVLLIEDDLVDARAVQRYLSGSSEGIQLPGHNITRVSTLAAGLDILSSLSVDVVLLDLGLPDSQGMETVKSIQRPYPAVPIIVLTGIEDEAIGVELLRSGAQDYFPKSKLSEFLLKRSIRYSVERKNVEKALLESEERYEKMLAICPDAVFVNQNNRIVFVNQVGLNLFGAEKEEQVLGKSPLEFIHPDFHPVVKERIRLIMEEKKSAEVLEEKVVGLDGKVRDVEVKAVPYARKDGWTILVLMRDVTEKKSLEVQMRQAQKMDAIGRLAGGVAHDFNNMLFVISGYAQSLQEECPPESHQRKAVEEIIKAADRASSLTHRLLAFSRKQVLEPKIVDINFIVRDMEKMLRRLIDESVEITLQLEDVLHKVKVDPGQLQQVILNLAVNARDAMPKGGKLTFETRNVNLDEGYARMRPEVRPGSYVMLSVGDTGHGISKETMAHIFEPFFTTKEVGKGTGLGLATVHGIVNQSGGHIWVYSEKNIGTVFKIYFPQVEENADVRAKNETELSVSKGAETILLVEDEAAVRELVRDSLQRHGYTVLEAVDGTQGLEVAQKHRGTIHLLISDVIMPRMSGPEMAKQLRSAWPKLRAIYMSGYTADMIQQHQLLHEDVSFLQKPFNTKTLLLQVRSVLDG